MKTSTVKKIIIDGKEMYSGDPKRAITEFENEHGSRTFDKLFEIFNKIDFNKNKL